MKVGVAIIRLTNGLTYHCNNYRTQEAGIYLIGDRGSSDNFKEPEGGPDHLLFFPWHSIAFIDFPIVQDKEEAAG